MISVLRFFLLTRLLSVEWGGCLLTLFLVFLFFFNFHFSLFYITMLNYFLIFLSLWLIYFLFQINRQFLLIFKRFLVIFFLAFRVRNFLFFFIMFELRLVPTYFLVLLGRTPERKFAGNYLILYTFLGALPLLFVLIFKGINKSFFFNEFFLGLISINYILVLAAFLIKLPIFFFHLWLPKAHVEASTEGSMVLAGILLKLGRYGLILCAPWFVRNYIWLRVFVIFGGVYAGLFRFVQLDLKALIAYSSILHMRFMVFASFSRRGVGLWGIILMSVGHGFISANMFFILSFIYNLTGSRKLLVLKRRLINYGLVNFLLAGTIILKSSAPLSINFFGELFLFVQIVPVLVKWAGVLIFLAKMLGGLLSIFFYLILFHGFSQENSFFISTNYLQISFFLILYCIFSLVIITFGFCKWT